MNNFEIVEPKVVDDIEFYCSRDGKQIGMSQRGLGLFAGISETHIRTILEKIRNGDAPEELKHLEARNLYCSITSYQRARVVDADVVKEIVWYMAILKNNPTAMTNLKRFLDLGIREFILRVTGFHKSELDVESPDERLGRILSAVERMEDKVSKLDNFIANTTVVGLPGLQQQFKLYSANMSHTLDSDYFSLTQWLETKGVEDGELTHGQKCRLGRLVAGLYEANHHKKPEKVSAAKIGAAAAGRPTCYKASDVPMLEAAYTQFLKSEAEKAEANFGMYEAVA